MLCDVFDQIEPSSGRIRFTAQDSVGRTDLKAEPAVNAFKDRRVLRLTTHLRRLVLL